MLARISLVFYINGSNITTKKEAGMNEEKKQAQSSTAGAAKGGNTILEGLTRYHHNEFSKEVHTDPCGEYFLAVDVERLLANAGVPAKLTDEQIQKVWKDVGGVDGWLKSFGFIQFARAIESEVLSAHAGVKAEPAAPVQTVETGVSERLRRIVLNHGDGTIPVQSKLLRQAADECDRFYNGMMAWKQTAQKKDRDWNAERMGRINERIRTNAAPALPAQAEQVAAVRSAALEEAARLTEEMYESGEGGAGTREAAKRIRSLAQSSTADKASEVQAAEEGGAA